jgi:hypothetical protein
MPEKLVTVATYSSPLEADLARNLLEAEGLEAFLSGDYNLVSLPLLARTPAIHLNVFSGDALRAVAVLAAQAAEASLERDWEEKAESGAGVWTCSLCGEPVLEHMEVCHACQTPRDALRADAPPGSRDEGIEIRDEVERPTPAAPVGRPPAQHPEPVARPPLLLPARIRRARLTWWQPRLPTREDFAGIAFAFAFLSLFGLPLFLPLSWWYIGRALMTGGTLRRRARRGLRYAIVINLLVLGCVLGLVAYWLRSG